MNDDLTAAIAAAVHDARLASDFTVAELAAQSGVSRAMISKIEKGEAQPTAALLARIAAATDLTLSGLIARAENPGSRLARHDEQPTWRDPDTGYYRRAVSPPAASVDLVEVDLPAGAHVTYPAAAFRGVQQQIWVMRGELVFTEGQTEHHLRAGDCLQLAPPNECTFANPTTTSCHYLVVVHRQS